jgi:hypothetical protein
MQTGACDEWWKDKLFAGPELPLIPLPVPSPVKKNGEKFAGRSAGTNLSKAEDRRSHQ